MIVIFPHIGCILSEQLFMGTPLEDCLWRYTKKDIKNMIIILIYQKLNGLEAAIENYSQYTNKLFYTGG